MSDLISPWEILSQLIAAEDSTESIKFIDTLSLAVGDKSLIRH